MSDPSMTFTVEFAVAMLDWNERLFRMYQARWQSKNIVATFRELDMNICAKNAAKIHQDIDLQLRTGELLMRMRSKFLTEHALTAVEMEQWRQFTAVSMVFYEMTEEEARTEYGRKTIDQHNEYVQAANAVTTSESLTAGSI